MTDPPWRAMMLALAAAIALAGCAPADVKRDAPPHEMLNAVLWQQHSAEYRASAEQAYRLAAERLAEALADPQWTAALEQPGDAAQLPPAVLLDIDETVLDNSAYEARIILELGAYSPQSFAAWCEEAAAAAVPGVGSFLAAARSQGVAIYFYTARRELLRSCTRRNLEALGLLVAGDDAHLLMNDGTGKSEWRRRVARDHRIVLLLGDNLEDFVAGSKSDPNVRRVVAERHGERWGRQWIILPNPMYGHWEAAFYGFDHGLPHEAKLERKVKGLETPEGAP